MGGADPVGSGRQLFVDVVVPDIGGALQVGVCPKTGTLFDQLSAMIKRDFCGPDRWNRPL